MDQPHAAIEGISQGTIVNFTDGQAAAARGASVSLVQQPPETVVAEVERLANLKMPAHHDVRAEDVNLRRLAAALQVAHERGPADFPELLLTPGIGARTLFALSLVAEVVHGAPSRFSDPARFSLAHGGKDGHPFPVPLTIYDETLRVLRRAVDRAKLGQDDKLAALRRLDQQCRALEAGDSTKAALSLPGVIREQRAQASGLQGRTCLDGRSSKPRQLRLPYI